MSQDGFISAVMERPALWQSKHKNYKNKNIKFKLWEEIKQHLFPGIEVSDLIKKWKNLKDTYRKELKKVPHSRSGDAGGSDDINKWKYFELMKFVKDEIVPSPSESNLTENSILEDETQTFGDIKSSSSIPNVESPASSESTQNTETGPPKKRPTPNDLRAEYLEIEKRKLQLLECELSKKEDSSHSRKSEDYHFLMSILPEMEKLNPIQKMRLRNKINQALMDEMNASIYGEPYNRYGYNTQPL